MPRDAPAARSETPATPLARRQRSIEHRAIEHRAIEHRAIEHRAIEHRSLGEAAR